MSEGIIKTLIVCATALGVTFIGGLCAIAIIRDDGSEAQIVTALIGALAIIGPIIYAVMQHWLGSKTMLNAMNAIQAQSPPKTPTIQEPQ